MKKSYTFRAIKLIMAFAIFWMVIGELITLHQEKIFGVHFYDHSNPFTKPKTKDDGKSFSFKVYKIIDKSYLNLDLSGSSIVNYQINHILEATKYNHTFPAKQAHCFTQIVRKPLRAPPTLL